MGSRLDAIRKWLSRGKLWDDVFTRTVSILISSAVIGLFLSATGTIHPDRQTWSVIFFIAYVIVIAGVGTFVLFPAGWRWYRHSTWRLMVWSLCICLFLLVMTQFVAQPTMNLISDGDWHVKIKW